MKKRLFMAVCLLILTLNMLPVGVFATEETPARAADECGEGITWSYDSGVLTISGDGKMDDFPEGTPWAAHKDEIEEVVLEGNISYIGAYAFKDCDGLLSVEFGDACYELGKEALASCDGLTSLWLPASFKVLGESSLQSCKNLEEIHCSGKVLSFRQNALWDTYVTIFFPAERPWSVDYIKQMEETFKGRVEFLASDGSDPYTEGEEEVTQEPTEAPTQMPTEAPAETPTEAPTEAATEAPAVVPAETVFGTEAEDTEAPTVPEAPAAPAEKSFSVGWAIAVLAVIAVACIVVLCVAIFGGMGKKGKYRR